MLRKGMFLGDRYEILEQIGNGGMSDVYKAKCHKLNRFVAIKVLKQEFSQDANFVSKFRIEAQSAAGLVHPNIVNVYDVGDEDGIYYIVMELVEGITLKRYIEKKGRLSTKEAVSIAIQVAQGIEAAHSHKIIHRDIKPQNIIISKEGKVKVTDFGIARASSSQTINSLAMGSVHYISPEQARGGYSDEKSDIYSFGITLYEMLTGIVPFDGDNTVAVAVRHIQDDIVPPSQVAEDVPISVDKIVLKCTSKKPDMRYQNATDLIADLKKSLVMPDVDFVKMIPAYAMSGVSRANAGITGEDSSVVSPSGENSADLEENNFKADTSDVDNDDRDFLDDLSDDDDDDDFDLLNERKARTYSASFMSKSKKKNTDYDEDSNERIDTIMKWLGIGIAALCAVIIIFVAVKLVGLMNGGSDNNAATQGTTTATDESSTIDTSDYVEVPDLKNMTEEEAKNALNKIGLGCKITRQPSDLVEKGKVISQGQKAGTMVPKNTSIKVAISEGVTTIVLQNLVNKTEQEAREYLEDLGLIVVTDYKYDDKIAQGNIVSQLPVANTSVKAGATVKLVVSRGAETKTIKVPSIVGESKEDAIKKLEASGFTNINVIQGSAAPSKSQEGVVTKVTPAAGSLVTSTTEITITIYGEYKEKETETIPSESQTDEQESTQSPTTAPEPGTEPAGGN
ncbi:MAG: Stk1 family PASTA domain-containing Ser/Thr kinase [Lachnospiraceae bacterium]